VLSLVPRLSTWRYPQPQLGRLQLSTDACCPRPSGGKRQMWSTGQTDRRTPDRYIAYYAGSVNNRLVCLGGPSTHFCGLYIRVVRTPPELREKLTCPWSRPLADTLWRKRHANSARCLPSSHVRHTAIILMLVGFRDHEIFKQDLSSICVDATRRMERLGYVVAF